MRSVLLRGVAPARAGAYRVQLVQTLVDPTALRHGLCAAAVTVEPQSIADPTNGASAASAKAVRHEVAPTTAANTGGTMLYPRPARFPASRSRRRFARARRARPRRRTRARSSSSPFLPQPRTRQRRRPSRHRAPPRLPQASRTPQDRRDEGAGCGRRARRSTVPARFEAPPRLPGCPRAPAPPAASRSHARRAGRGRGTP